MKSAKRATLLYMLIRSMCVDTHFAIAPCLAQVLSKSALGRADGRLLTQYLRGCGYCS